MNYFKRCSKCSEWKDSPEFSYDSKRHDGFNPWCKKCVAGNSKAWRIKNRERDLLNSRLYVTTPHGRFVRAKSVAKVRGVSFTLSESEYTATLKKSECAYCDGYFGAVSKQSGIGLDRINNAIGYVNGNVAPSCGYCNRLKGDKLSAAEAHAAIGAIIALRTKNLEIAV